MAEYQATIYDDVWRTMVNDFPDLLIAFVNELFATSYDETCQVELLQDTHEQNRQDGAVEKRITDSFFRIISRDGVVRHYHIECQSTRMIVCWSGCLNMGPRLLWIRLIVATMSWW